MKRFRFLLFGIVCVAGISPVEADTIPYFARKYNLSCVTCHISPPKLNDFGEDFRLGAYRMPEMEKRRAIPVSIWVSGRGEHLPATEVENIRSFLNRVEFISGGTLGTDRLSYFVEWRTVSLETLSDGSLRDRSGRFEDLFITVELDRLDVTIGQFRQVEQVDVSTRPGLSEPVALSGSLPGFGEGTPRVRGLRGFAPSARSPAARLTFTESLRGDWSWATSAAVPLPGEFSLPLTRQARVNASNELEWNPKGIVLESFVRSGLASYGGHLFFRSGDYWLSNAVATGSFHSFYWTVIAGFEQAPGIRRSRWSLEALYALDSFASIGGRFEERTGDGLAPAVIPYANLHFPGTRYTLRLTVEHRFQRHRSGTFVEIATIF